MQVISPKHCVRKKIWKIVFLKIIKPHELLYEYYKKWCKFMLKWNNILPHILYRIEICKTTHVLELHFFIPNISLIFGWYSRTPKEMCRNEMDILTYMVVWSPYLDSCETVISLLLIWWLLLVNLNYAFQKFNEKRKSVWKRTEWGGKGVCLFPWNCTNAICFH